MKRNNKKNFKKNTNSINKLSLFQKNEGKFSRKCPLSVKNAPIVDYKNIGLLKKYVSENIVDELLDSGREIKLGGTKSEVCIMFCDIRGFTSMSEKMMQKGRAIIDQFC